MVFAEIFTEMGWVPATLLCVGMVFCIIEIFVPGFGFFGISGILMVITGAIVRIFNGLNLTQTLTLILMILGFIFVAVIVFIFGAKNGFLEWTGLFENKSSISADYNKTTKAQNKLIGKHGKTITTLNLAGKAKIDGKIYDVLSLNSYIEAGKNIKVVDIKDNQLIVRKFFE